MAHIFRNRRPLYITVENIVKDLLKPNKEDTDQISGSWRVKLDIKYSVATYEDVKWKCLKVKRPVQRNIAFDD
jgi:hypothetical protein